MNPKTLARALRGFLLFVPLFLTAAALAQRPSADIFENPSQPGGRGEVHSNADAKLPATLTHAKSVQAAAGPQALALATVTPGGPFSEDIQHIVLACGNDPKKLFDFVRNHIRFTPYFGFRKGAELTWLTKSGNDADQAELLVTLLQAAGYSAQYEYGQLSIPLAQALAWFGVDDGATLDQVLGSSGYPGIVDEGAGVLIVENIWASATVDSATYRFHPAYKTFTTLPGIDLDAALGYSSAALATAAGGTETAISVQGVSDAGVSDYLRDRAMALVNVVRTTYPNAEVDEIVGGRRIVPGAIQALGDAFPSGFTVNDSVLFSNPDAIGDRLTVVVGTSDGAGGLSQVRAGFTFSRRSIGARRISVTFAADGHAQVWIDDDLVDEEATPVPGGGVVLGLAIDHDYFGDYYDAQRVVDISRTGSYAVLADAGGYEEPELARRAKLRVDEYRRQGLAVDSREIRTEALYLLGLDWARQWAQSVDLLSRQARFLPLFHHSLAVFSQDESFQVDIPTTIVTLDRSGDLDESYANLRSVLLMGSAMESSVIRQDYPGTDAVSTVRYTRRNNALGKKTFLANDANYNSVYADPDFTAGWSGFYREVVFPDLIYSPDAWQMILPEDGAQQVDHLTGNGYFQFNTGTVGAIISNPLYSAKGGHATTLGQVDPALDPTPVEKTEGPDNLQNPQSKEPIDLYSGAYIYDHADLTLGGDGARGLTFSRSYSSAGSGAASDLGPGWNHSYNAYLAGHSDSSAAFGRTTPVAAAAMIAAHHAIRDMMRNDQNTAKGWVVGSIAAGWAMDRLENNTISVVANRKNLAFTKLADGSYAPAAGITANLVEDGGTGLFRIEERFGRTTYFDAQRRIATYVDADGKTLAYAYNGDGKVETVTDCYGRTLTFAYQGTGVAARLASVSDSTGRSVGFGYDASGRLASVTDPESGVTQFLYDAEDRLNAMIDQNGETVAENTFDSVGRVIAQIAEGDPAQEWIYAFTGFRNVEINPAGNRSTYLFDAKGRQTGLIDGEGNAARMAYDGQNQTILATNPRGNSTQFQYDGRNNLRFVINANGHTREMVYDGQDHLDYVLDEAGKKTDFTYDAEHHLTGVTDPLLRTTAYQFYAGGAADGLVQNIVENNGDTTAFVYDANGHPDTITRPDGSVMDATYNARGDLTASQIATVGDPNVHAVTMTYDMRRLMLTARDALNFGITNVFDARGRLVSQTDRFGNTTSQSFSPWGRNETATAPNGATALFHNDTAGRRDQATNALGQATQYGFDQADRLTAMTDALNQLVSYGYDAASNRDSLTNARNKTWSWAHTAVNLVDTLTSPAGRVWDSGYNTRELLETFQEPSLDTSVFQYFDDQRLKQMTDPVGTLIYGYDTKARLDTVTEGSAVIDRDYDSLDRLIKFTDSAGNAIEYTYDGAGNIRTIEYPGGKTVTYTYDSADRLDFVTDWNGRVTDFQYNARSQLAAIVFPNGTRRILTYDSAGRVASMRDETSMLQVISQFGFGYDILNRIQQETATPEPDFTILPAIMAYDDDDRLVTWNGQPCASDPDGNLTSGPLQGNIATLGYDARNRLTSAGTTTYTYDAENRRTSQTTGGVTTSYVHDPQDTLSRLLMRTTDVTTTYYVYAAGMLLYEETDGATKTHHYDYRGSTVALTDDSETVTDRIFYGPYGETVARIGTTDTPFLFHGAYGVETDANGLICMRARYYSPEIRRFLNADPLGFDAGINWYAFVFNDPINRVDPSGLMFRYTSGTLTHVSLTNSAGVTTEGYMNSSQLIAHLESAPPGSISAVTITGHGAPNIMQLSDGTFLTTGNDRLGRPMIMDENSTDVTSVFRDALSPSATVCLQGCNTAAFVDGTPSIAEIFARNVQADGKVIGYPLLSLGIPGTGLFLGLPIEFPGLLTPPKSKP